METVTLRAEDFKTVHNTLCELRSVQERLTGVISNELADRLHSVIKGFDAGLADAYAQDNAAFERKHDHYEFIGLKAGIRVSRWSIYEVEDLEAEHPYKGAERICYRDHWGDAPVFREIKGPRWRDLWKAADLAIEDSGDQHHIFIESFVASTQQPGTLRLTTGS